MSQNGTDSCSNSTVGLPPLHLSNHYAHQKHSEQWVLPKHWKMDLREPFQNWKYDVRCQVANMEQQLAASLRQYGNPDIYDPRGRESRTFNVHREQDEMEARLRRSQQSRLQGHYYTGMNQSYRY